MHGPTRIPSGCIRLTSPNTRMSHVDRPSCRVHASVRASRNSPCSMFGWPHAHLEVQREKWVVRQQAVAPRCCNQVLAEWRDNLARLLAKHCWWAVYGLLHVAADAVQGQVVSNLHVAPSCALWPHESGNDWSGPAASADRPCCTLLMP